MNIVILAGGGGARLWPMSRKNKAKQFNVITNDKTMLENTLDRFKGAYPPEKIFISTTPRFEESVREILPDFSQKNIIVEPDMRDTAAAMGYVCSFLSTIDPDEPVAFIPSDHYIRDNDIFQKALEVAEGKIRKTGKLLDIGIIPEYPSTALGYTKVGKRLEDVEGIKLYEFLGHKEKPTFPKAQKYLRSGNYLWHGNFYMWTPRLFLKAFKRYAPDVYAPLSRIAELFKERASDDKIAKEYSQIPKIMIDYAITEKMDPKDVLIIRGEFGWSDIGSWDVLHEKLIATADERGNLVKGDWIGIDTTQSVVYSYSGKIVATIGVDDMVIVDTQDALLVCPKGRAQDVKNIVEDIKKHKTRKKYA